SCRRSAICFQPSGATNSIRPSSTSTRHSAAHSSLMTAGARSAGASAFTEVAGELGIAVHDRDIAAVAEHFAIRLQAAGETVELGIGTVGGGVDLGGTAFAFTTQGLRVALGFGHDHVALPVGVGTHALGGFGTLRAQFVGDAATFLAHAPEHRIDDFAVFGQL